MASTTIIVLAWNSWPLTEQCLRSLRETDLGTAEVLVVDNGSTDETPLRLAEIPWVRTLRLPENLGFVRGNNAGIEISPRDADIVLVNNDTVFHQHDWLTRMRATAESSPEIGVVGCRLVTPDGHLLHAGTYVLPDTCWGQQIGSSELELGQYAADREVQGIVFACAYIKRAVIEGIGGLALDFSSYFEDTDYCLRAKEAGWKTMHCGSATVVHDEHGSSRTPEADAARVRTFETSRSIFRDKWAARLERHYRRTLLWQSIMNFPTGYATSCRALVHGLEDSGIRMVYRYVYGLGSVFWTEEPAETGDYLLDVVSQRAAPADPAVAVVYGQPDVFARNLGRYKIGYTMLEVDGFPRDWVHMANGMDEIWVPSEFNRQGFLRSGLTKPVHCMPLGVDTDHFHPGIRRVANPNGEYIFLSCFEWGERKAPEILLRAFNEAFSDDEPVRLICKINNTDQTRSVRHEIQQLGLRASGGRVSYLFNLEFPYYQLATLYRSADCYVSASRGEGWNMPLMEAMACGLPAIATDWGAHQEFFHPSVGYPLRVRGTVPAVAKCPYYKGFSWADPDPEHLRLLLRQVYENQDEAAALGLAASREMQEKWTWRQAARRIVTHLEELS